MQRRGTADLTGETIRAMAHADIDQLERLRHQAGFNQTVDDWHRLLRLEPDGCFVAVHGDLIVGTVTTTVYSNRLAWIGMVIVDESSRRLGIGSRLVERALHYLDSDHRVQSVALDATASGKQVYDHLGFIDQYGVHRLQGDAPRVSAANVVGARQMHVEDLPEVIAMDSDVLGVERPRLIEELFLANPSGCSVVESDGRVAAWSFRRQGAVRWHIGPVVAVDQQVADIALSSALAAIPGEGVEVDSIEGPSHAHVAARFNLAAARSFIRMARGRSLPTSHLTTCYATAAPELG